MSWDGGDEYTIEVEIEDEVVITMDREVASALADALDHYNLLREATGKTFDHGWAELARGLRGDVDDPA